MPTNRIRVWKKETKIVKSRDILESELNSYLKGFVRYVDEDNILRLTSHHTPAYSDEKVYYI